MVTSKGKSFIPTSVRWMTIVAVILIWFVATDATRVLGAGRFPSMHDVYESAVQSVQSQGYAGGSLWAHIFDSCRLVVCGFLVAAVTGVPFGLLMGWNSGARALLNPVFSLLRPIPPLAWIPLSILWFGLDESAKIFVIWLSAFVPCVINSYVGIRDVEPVLGEAARVHGASQWQLLVKVLLPASMPMVFTGLRVALQMCWSALVAAEMVGASHGLGHVLTVASLDLYPGMILLAMALVGICGALMTKLLSMSEANVLRWMRKEG